jgi:virulence factor Mce-like protein
MRGRSGGIAGSPVLIGAATVLVIVVAMFLSYNANQGLPFVPSYQLKVETPSAANLVKGNDVRIGGARVGAISAIEARRRDDGSSYALLTLQMERDVAPLPKDSTVIIRPRSVLGLKYVEITRGTAREGWREGDVVPVAQAQPRPVEFDEFTNMFDARTRAAIQGATAGTGTALAGRGASLNQAIGALGPLLRDLVPVMRNLSDPDTQLARFIRELGDAAAEVAPVAEVQAALFANLDTTFAALRAVAPQIQESIAEGPATLDAAIESFPVQRPFLANAEGLFRELRPGVQALRTGAPALAGALSAGTPVLGRAPAFNARLEPLLAELQRFAEDPVVPRGIARLTQTAELLRPILAHVTPAQTVCNYGYLWFRNVASLLSEGDVNGTWQRFIIIATPQGPNNEGGPSSAPADGPTEDNHLHVNPYPNTASPGQPRECEAGNEPYLSGRTILTNTPGTQPVGTESAP